MNASSRHRHASLALGIGNRNQSLEDREKKTSTAARMAGAVGIFAIVGLLLVPTAASADKVVVNAIGTGAGGTTGGLFSIPRGLAVNTTGTGGVPAGTVYVVDTFNNRVQAFSPSGVFLRAFGANVGGTGVDICTVAASCVEGTAGAAAGQFGFAGGEGITVDQSNGNLYITDEANRRLDVFSATGTFEGAFGREVKVTGAGEELQFCTTATGCQAGATANTSAAGAFGTTLGYPAVAPAGSPDEGNLYVADNANRRVDEFEPTIVGGEVTGVAFVRGYGWGASTGAEEFEVCSSTCHEPSAAGSSLGQFAIEAPSELGIDSAGNVYALDPGNNRVQKFSATPAPLNSSFASAQLATTPAPTDIAIDPSVGGHVYANKSNGTEINSLEFESNGALIATNGIGIGLTITAGLAYDPNSGNIWLSSIGTNQIFALNTEVPPTATLSEPVDVTGPNSAVFEGEVNPKGFDATYRFEYSTDGVNWTRLPASDVDLGPGASPISVSKEAIALLANTEYLLRLVATKPFGAGTVTTAPATFQTPAGAPAIDSVSAANITSNSVELRARVNPEGAEVSTSPPNECHFQYIDESSYLADGESYGEGTHSAPCAPANLGAGSDDVLVSTTIGGLGADTAYHYRLLAANSVGATIGSDHIQRTFGVAPSGLPDGRAYEMVSPPQKLGEVFPPEPSQTLGSRFGSNCPLQCLPGVNSNTMPMQSAPDGEAIVYQGQPFFGGLAATPNEYLSHRTSSGWSTESLSPLLSVTLGHFGHQGFSSDLSDGVIAQTEPALSPSAPTFEGEAYANLYLSGGGGFLQPLVTGKPEHRDPGEDLFGNSFRIFYAGANSGTPSVPAFSHVVFEANDALTKEVPGIAPEAEDGGNGGGEFPATNLNLYEWVGGQLRLVNVKPDNATTAPGAVIGSGHLLTDPESPDVDHAISADGRRIFWSEEATGRVFVRIDGRETQEIHDPGEFLTASVDGAKVLLNDGCLYDLEAEACEDLAKGEGEFRGTLGASEDLSRVYFVDEAVLTVGEENANENEEHAELGAINLYSWHKGAIAFIGKLLSGDNGVGPKFGDWQASPLIRTAQVSADGGYLAFMSRARLTGYNNEVRSIGCRGVPNETSCYEVFEYDASSTSLTCASCNPTGQRPLGQSNLSLIRPQPIGPQPGNLTADGQGRLFFESQDELSPRDTNGPVQDVYEWKPGGVGSCKRAEGCVDLISSGHGSGDSFFLDATPSGNDAFIVTREQMLPQDKDDRLDLYDARVNGGIEAVATNPCSGEACKGPISSPPAVQGPGTGAISPPNPPASCKRGFVKKHGRCVKKKHHKHHKRPAKHNRGGSK